MRKLSVFVAFVLMVVFPLGGCAKITESNEAPSTTAVQTAAPPVSSEAKTTSVSKEKSTAATSRYSSYDTTVYHPLKILHGYESQILHRAVEDVLNAVNKKDKEKLKSIMAETVLKDDKNLDREIETLFNFIDGAFTDYEEGFVQSYMHTNGGIKEHRLSSCVTVFTNNKTYYLKIAYVNVDAQNKRNEGILGLAFIEKELYDKYEQNGVCCFEWATLSISCLNEHGEIKP